MQLLSFWDIGKCLCTDTSGLFIVQTLENVCLHVVKYSVPCSLVSNSRTSKNVWDLAQAAPPDQNRCVLSNIYSCVFYPSLSDGSSAAESMSTVFYLGRMENDVNLYFLPKSLCFVISTAISPSSWESSCTRIAECIWKWKHRNGYFPMWFRFSSKQVYVVNFLHYRGQCNYCRFSGRSSLASSSLFLCIFTFEF